MVENPNDVDKIIYLSILNVKSNQGKPGERVMKIKKVIFLLAIASIFSIASLWGSSVDMKISGPGAVNDSTIKAGEKVSFDLYISNDATYKGFSLGFTVSSPTIKKVTHEPDKGNGLNKNGDIKGYNGWHDRSTWDLAGIFVVEKDWDGMLPDLIGFGGVCKSMEYTPHKKEKKLSFEMTIPETGTIVIDSSYFAPTGYWLFTPPSIKPEWGGPYQFNVIK